MSRMLMLLAAMVMSMNLVSCDLLGSDDDDKVTLADYFPLEVGNKWTYDYIEGTETAMMTLEVIGMVSSQEYRARREHRHDAYRRAQRGGRHGQRCKRYDHG